MKSNDANDEITCRGQFAFRNNQDLNRVSLVHTVIINLLKITIFYSAKK